jgi:mannose-6-phosphate isomerase-like protein (cupin superfamily)
MNIVYATDRSFVPAAHENPQSPGVWKKVLLQRADLQAGNVQMINWARLPPDKHFAAHYHEDMQEVFVILAGEVQIRVAGQTAVLRRGDTIVIDAREVHQMSNAGPADAEYLAMGITAGAHGRTVVVPSAIQPGSDRGAD